MDFGTVEKQVLALGQPHISASQGRDLYDHIIKTRPKKALELGTARGGSALFIAAALEANNFGHLTSVDSSVHASRWASPTPTESLAQAGLKHRVTLDKRFSTYTWFLKTEIERCMKRGVVHPEYDFVFIDGPKNWTTDGLSVILAEKLLRPGGWLLLDDMGWTYEGNFERCSQKSVHYDVNVQKLSDDEKQRPHIEAVYKLLVRTNPAFDTFNVQGWFGWARKADRRPATP